jgi:hypothetical protein
MPSITIKKPRFVGVSAGLLAEAATNGIPFTGKAERSAAARKAIADAYMGHDVTILRVRGERLVLTDPMPASLPAPIEVECTGTIAWSGPTGAIVVATAK